MSFPINPDLSAERRSFNRDAAWLLRHEKLPPETLKARLALTAVSDRLYKIRARWHHTRYDFQSLKADRLLALVPKHTAPQPHPLLKQEVLVDFSVGGGNNIKVQCKVHRSKQVGRQGFSEAKVMLEVSPTAGAGKVWVRANRVSKLQGECQV